MVGGVFLRLFIANPSWGLRQPRQFATELIERTLTEMRSGNNADMLQTLSTALVALLRHHPNTADQASDERLLRENIAFLVASSRLLAAVLPSDDVGECRRRSRFHSHIRAIGRQHGERWRGTDLADACCV